jgi:hypothetical protein
VTAAQRLEEQHRRLCFTRAFPASAGERQRAVALLERFEARARKHRSGLENTGIAGTVFRYPFNHTMAEWLCRRYGRAVEIDWPAYKRHAWDEVAALLSLQVAWAENEGLDDDDVPSWDWVRHARRGHPSDLAWLLAVLRRGGHGIQLERHLFECLNLPLVWDLTGSRDSITHACLPVRRVFYHRRLLTERPADFRSALREPIGDLVPAGRVAARRLIDAARAALSLREREFHVVVHANPDEVYRVDAGRGLMIVVFGLARPLRLTLEADYGALLVRNGVPIGYGYAALLFDRADLAVNVFPDYRGGESPWVFTRFATLFHRHFGARHLVMRRYQVGHQNPEGIESGSFWFYHKLGFRPVRRAVRELARIEAERLARRPGARSGPGMLRRLARSDMALSLEAGDDWRDADLKRVGLAVTRHIERRYGGDRKRALLDAARRVARALDVASVPARMAPVAALIPDLALWPVGDRRAVARLMAAKEGKRERPFVLAMNRATRFKRWLLRSFPAGA